MTAPTIVVAGGFAQRAGHGGHAWMFLQYLLGFRRLGYEVLFVDRLEPSWCPDEDGRPGVPEQSAAMERLRTIMRAVSPPVTHAVLVDGGDRSVGVDRSELVERVRRSVMVLDVMGYLDDEELMDVAPLTVFLDIDPGFPQMWHMLGWADVLGRHDAYASVGANIGRADCGIPTCGIDWLATRPPVVLDQWPVRTDPGRAITTVGTWRGPFGPVEYEGRVYGLRAHEFRRFIELPKLTGVGVELALDIDAADSRDRARLVENLWTIVDPAGVASSTESYRSYVQGSRAEFMVAKGMYVQTRSGWFSDRTTCYLASGRPCLVQDTGLTDLYPLGTGLLTFSTLEQAVEGVEAIERDYEWHAIEARRIAECWFDSDRVLRALLQQLGVG